MISAIKQLARIPSSSLPSITFDNFSASFVRRSSHLFSILSLLLLWHCKLGSSYYTSSLLSSPTPSFHTITAAKKYRYHNNRQIKILRHSSRSSSRSRKIIMDSMKSNHHNNNEEKKKDICSNTNTNDDDDDDKEIVAVINILRKQFPSMISYEILNTIIQANASGYRIRLMLPSSSSSSSKTTKKELFVKRVMVSNYVNQKKDWADLRRTLMYIRTEVRFYKDVMPYLQKQQQQQYRTTSTPKVYFAECHLDGWIDDDECAVSPSDNDHIPTLWKEKDRKGSKGEDGYGGSGGTIIMECVSNDHYYQKSPLSIAECKQCLSAIAKLHASGWENQQLLQQCEKRLSKSSFCLPMRNPNELKDIIFAWEHFQTHFESYLKQYDDHSNNNSNKNNNKKNLYERTMYLGQRIQVLADYISKELDVNHDDQYATLVHGDYKSMNVFLSKENNNDGDDNNDDQTENSNSPAIMIDYASTGVGLGILDVAMHIHHAVHGDDLDRSSSSNQNNDEDDGENELLNYYLLALRKDILSIHKANTANNGNDNDHDDAMLLYPDSVAKRHYKLAVLDYFRFFLGRFWKSATPETFEKKKDSENTSYINRNIPSAISFINRVEQYLTDIEMEQTKNK